jgi:hypothetical protein
VGQGHRHLCLRLEFSKFHSKYSYTVDQLFFCAGKPLLIILMKAKLTLISIFLAAMSAIARIVVPFPGWENLESSSDIIAIVHCGSPVAPVQRVMADNAPKSTSTIEIITFLKGTNSAVSGKLETDRYLHEGDDYLVFASYHDDAYKAFETYKVIPVGNHFPVKSILGKPLDEQVKTLAKYALFDLNRKIQQDKEQKAQLEMSVGGSEPVQPTQVH